MPCYDTRDHNCGNDAELRAENARLQARCDKLTDLLCQAGKAAYSHKEAPPAVHAWWDAHRRIDAARGESW